MIATEDQLSSNPAAPNPPPKKRNHWDRKTRLMFAKVGQDKCGFPKFLLGGGGGIPPKSEGEGGERGEDR